jgi:hypothetical protein
MNKLICYYCQEEYETTHESIGLDFCSDICSAKKYGYDKDDMEPKIYNEDEDFVR